MLLLLYILLVGFGASILAQCKSKEEDIPTIKLTSNFTPPQFSTLLPKTQIFPARSYIGQWEFSMFMYSEHLSINPDGTFKYSDRGCTGSSFSKGKWIDNGRYLILNSNKEYAHYPGYNDYKPLHKTKKRKTNQNSIDISYELDPTFINSVPFSFDSIHRYFDNERLVLHHNKLYQLNNFDTLTPWGHTGYLLTKPQLSL